MRTRTAALLEAGAAGLGYATLSGAVAFVTALGLSQGATFWPGAGLTLSLLVVRPRSRWPAILAGVFVAEVVMDVHFGFPVDLSLAWGVANTAEPLVGAVLLTRAIPGRPDLRHIDVMVRFVVFAVVVGPVVGAVIGTGAGVLLAGDPWWPRLPRWLAGDATGVLALAPAVVAFRRDAWRLGRSSAVSGVVLLAAVVVAFGPWSSSISVGLPYLVIPALAFVGLYAGVGGAAAGVFAVAVVVELVTAAGAGPFAEDGAFHGLVVAQLFLLMAAATALLVAALSAELMERALADAGLRAEALSDSLTGIANRRLLDDRLTLADRRLERGGGLVVVVLDLDGLKQVNDTLGHRAGDAVLKETARRLQAAIRPGDTAARFGGDEFVAVCEAIPTMVECRELGLRILEAATAPLEWEGRSVEIRASIGVARADGLTSVDAHELLDRADEAMYEAKRSGGGLAIAAEAALS